MNQVDQKTEDRLTALEGKYQKIIDILEPIAETYRAASKFGKWSMAFLVFISILLGVVLSIKTIFK